MSKIPDREELIRKIKALLNTNGRTEAEIITAARKAHELLAKYSISLGEVHDDQDEVFVDVNEHPGKYNESWRRVCYQAAASLYMCNYFFRSYSGNKAFAIKHCIVGESHNVAVALEMGQYFESTINRLANEACRDVPHIVNSSHTGRHRFIRTFRLSAADRLYRRIREYIAQAKAGSATAEDGSTLPAMLDLYANADELYARWREQNGIELGTVKRRDKQLSAAGRAMGREAGDNINFTNQIGGAGASSNYALPSS